MADRLVERLWESRSPGSMALRTALTPASWLYGGVIRARNTAFDRGWLESYDLGLPTVSVGNLTVGGTGKTPIASWFAGRMVEHGARPAILLRGYGGDETLVHRALVPDAIVIADADRVRAARQAAQQGATALVLDDGFQHRRARRSADVVLLSADRHRQERLLPAGPWREPEGSLRRATHIVVTRKHSTQEEAVAVAERASRIAPAAAVAVAQLAADALVRVSTGKRLPVDAVAGRSVLSVSAVGDPRAFAAQLGAVGARCIQRAFPDHHAFTEADAHRLARDATDTDFAVCTLKDAVKLESLWPPSAPPLWYLSQRVNLELGADVLESLARMLAGRAHDR